MENGKVRFHQRARLVMMALTPEDKDLVLHAVKSLGESSPHQWPEGKVSKLDTPEDVYVLRVNPKIRVLFRLTEDRAVKMLDVVFRDTLKFFATQAD